MNSLLSSILFLMLASILAATACATPPTPVPTASSMPLPPVPMPTPTEMMPTPTAMAWPTRAYSQVERVIVVTDVPTSTQPAAPKTNWGPIASDAELLTETEHFTFYVEGGHVPVTPGGRVPVTPGGRVPVTPGGRVPVTLAELERQAKAIFDYVSARLGVGAGGAGDPLDPIPVSFRARGSEPCGPRGFTAMEPSPQVAIFTGADSDPAYVFGVLAHELGHVLVGRTFERGYAGLWGLNEGLATWAAGRYWHAWQGSASFAARVRSYRQRSVYRPLYQNYKGPSASPDAQDQDCIAQRDILYTEWGAFVGFLIERYGLHRLHALAESATFEAGEEVSFLIPPDFEAVYGAALNQLEAAWLEEI